MREAMIAEAAAPELEPYAAAPATVLAVDDNPASRYVSVRALREAGFRVLEADCGERALALMASAPDVVVLDVHLPDISGFEVCRRIKANPATARISVLHLSATAVELEDKVEGLAAGADAYLVEPLHPSELIAVVKALLRMRRAEDQARRRAAEAEQARRQLQAVLDAMGEGLCQLDPQGRVVYVNAAAERIFRDLFHVVATP